MPLVPGRLWRNDYESNDSAVVVMHDYNEGEMIARLTRLNRVGRAAFAAACAERLAPLFLRYAATTEAADGAALRAIIDEVWRAVSGEDCDLRPLQAAAEDLVPDDEGEWSTQTAYAQNAAACSAYAVRAWLTDDPQEAAWAARQLYEAADHAAQQIVKAAGIRPADLERMILGHDLVQAALGAIEDDLTSVEGDNDVTALARRAADEGMSMARRKRPTR